VTKLMNVGLIVLSVAAGGATSWVVYREVRRRIRHAEGNPPAVDELAAEAVEDAGEGAPLLAGEAV
jgi:hypothetical protein